MLDYLIQTNDRVKFNMDAESRGYSDVKRRNGSKGTVVGKNRYQRTYARVGIDTWAVDKPGIYEKDGSIIVQWDDGQKEIVSSYHLEALNKNDWNKRIKDNAEKNSYRNRKENDLLNMTYVGPLPDTKLWEGDLAKSNDRHYPIVTIEGIEYDWHSADDERGTCYRVSLGERSGTTYLSDCDLELISRGNVWKYYNKESLVFKDLQEEVNFFGSILCQCDEVRNPSHGMYCWTVEEAKGAVRTGLGDVSRYSDGLFGGATQISVLKMHNRDLGERARQMFLDSETESESGGRFSYGY